LRVPSKETRATLRALVNGSSSIDETIACDMRRLVLGLNTSLAVYLDQGRARLRHYYNFHAEFGVPALGVALLADTAYDYRDELCICGLASCENFFFELHNLKGGRPQRRYCCSNHLEKAHDENAPRRMANFRKNQARKK
jgi:hypothetical protein